MARFTVPEIDPETERRLRALAGQNGVSPELQIKRLILSATKTETQVEGESLLDVVTRLKAKHQVFLEEREVERMRGGIREVELD